MRGRLLCGYYPKVMGYMGIIGIEKRKVDKQGRLIIPPDWRDQLGESREVLVLKGEGFLKIIPLKKGDLTAFFDSVDLGIDKLDDWDEFERKIKEKLS